MHPVIDLIQCLVLVFFFLSLLNLCIYIFHIIIFCSFSVFSIVFKVARGVIFLRFTLWVVNYIFPTTCSVVFGIIFVYSVNFLVYLGFFYWLEKNASCSISSVLIVSYCYDRTLLWEIWSNLSKDLEALRIRVISKAIFQGYAFVVIVYNFKFGVQGVALISFLGVYLDHEWYHYFCLTYAW